MGRTPCSVWLLIVLMVPFVVRAGEEKLYGKLLGKLQFPDKSPFNITTKITLNHGEHSTYSRADGSFIFHQVETGTVHVLDVQSLSFHFSQVKLIFKEEDPLSPTCWEYTFPGAPALPTVHPLALTAMATYEYFEARQGFSIMSILQNPMFLMLGFTGVMMFMMPKMMEGLEPEERQRMKQQMELQRDPTKMLSQMWGDITGTAEETKPRKIKK